MPRRRYSSGGGFWIQEAIQRPGALRAWLKANRERVEEVTGEDPFDSAGRIKTRVLKKLKAAHKRGEIRLSPRRIRQINLAITLKKLSRGE